MSTHVPQQRLPLPFQGCFAHIVETTKRPLTLSHDLRGGVNFSRLDSFSEDEVRLTSGQVYANRQVIAPSSLCISGSRPYWGGPGLGLWEVVLSSLPSETLDQLKKEPGANFSGSALDQFLLGVFAAQRKAKRVITGIEPPLHSNSVRVSLDAERFALLEIDLVTEQAVPRLGCDGMAVPLMMLRWVPVDQWRAAQKNEIIRQHEAPPLKEVRDGVLQDQETVAALSPEKIEEEKWRLYVASLRKTPTRLEAQAWAEEMGYGITRGRQLHRELGARPAGRPRGAKTRHKK